MDEKNIHVVQPYYVGNKNNKSLALIIPNRVVKKLDLGASSILLLKVDEKHHGMILRNMESKDIEQNFPIFADEKVSPNQQIRRFTNLE